ncbi:bifunctional DNA primase/polymerase [Spartinivicinus ruber]|uniref:bifunctional DNA primase/polymerase n=1 Tax=Spartinivicinus ruber TaxID=2683272 RepID=UPI0013D06311|nr:bifunctional DNA primase/polymerase [Spartinivicinus ruber]
MMPDLKPEPTEDIAWQLNEQGFTLIPLGSPFDTPPPYFVNDRCDGDLEKAKERWPKTPRTSWHKYQKQPPSDQEIENWTHQFPYANYAIVTGRNVIVVDADSEEAVQFMESGAVGRTPWKVKTAKGKHYYFQPNKSVDIRNSVNSKTKIDFRGHGGYVVAPGSTHASGTKYEWEIDPTWPVDSIHDLPYLTEQDLITINQFNDATKPATGNIGFNLADYYHHKADGNSVNEGERNKSAVSLVGQYLAGGMDLYTIKQILNEWDKGNNPPLGQAELNTCIASLVATHLRNHPHDVVPVYPIVASQPKDEPVPESLPDHLYKVPGVLGEVVKYMNDTATKKQPALAIQSALALGSVICGRFYRTNKNNFSSLYFLNIAKSSSGKEHGKKIVERILEAADLGELISGSGYTSAGAVFSELLTRPVHISIIDEFGKLIESSQKANNTQKDEAITQLVECWGRCDGTMRPPSYSTMTLSKSQAEDVRNRVIRSPALTLLAMTTPGTFYNNLNSQLVRDGFLGRLLIMESHLSRQPSIDPDVRPVPESILNWIKAVRSNLAGNITEIKAANETVEQKVLVFQADALMLLKEFEQELLAKQEEVEQQGLDVLLGRTREKAMRISLILALSKNPYAKTIEKELVKYAIDYVRYLDFKLLETVSKKVGGSKFETELKSCEDIIRKAGAKGLTKYEISRSPAFSKLDPKQEDLIFKALMSRGLAQFSNNIKTRGRSRAAWVHAAYFAENK